MNAQPRNLKLIFRDPSGTTQRDNAEPGDFPPTVEDYTDATPEQIATKLHTLIMVLGYRTDVSDDLRTDTVCVTAYQERPGAFTPRGPGDTGWRPLVEYGCTHDELLDFIAEHRVPVPRISS